jgi:hypothetical protein
VTQRNGYRDRLVATAGGDVELRIPKLRAEASIESLSEFAQLLQDLALVLPDTFFSVGDHPVRRRAIPRRATDHRRGTRVLAMTASASHVNALL